MGHVLTLQHNRSLCGVLRYGESDDLAAEKQLVALVLHIWHAGAFNKLLVECAILVPGAQGASLEKSWIDTAGFDGGHCSIGIA